MVKTGDKLDLSFSLEVIQNGEIETKPFSELLIKPLVVSVYMKNNTGSCDKQNASLGEHAEAINALGYNILAISKDGCKSHEKYAEKLNLDYILASDEDHLFSKAADAIVEKKMYGKVYEGPSRSAYVIATDGTVLGVIEKVDAKNHGPQVLDLLHSLN